MMIDLGQYSWPILNAYGATFLILFIVLIQSVWRSITTKSKLRKIEQTRGE